MSNRVNPLIYQVINVIAVLAALIFNSLVNILPLNGVTSGEVSDAFPNLFTPPGYVFIIWAVIYILAIIFMIYQALPSQRGQTFLSEIGPFYAIGAILNIFWLIVFHYSYPPALGSLIVFTPFIIMAFLVVLLVIYVRLGIGTKEVSVGEKIGIQLHVSVYLGWISLATIANLAAMLNFVIVGIPIATQELWTVLVLIVALVITLLMIFRRRDFAFGLVVVWASFGIASKQIASQLIYVTAIITPITIILAILVVPFIMKKGFKDFYMSR
ncbi:MAG: hypothetical protein ACXADL_08970 [Candidatus Thorarchaeota archaeon]